MRFPNIPISASHPRCPNLVTWSVSKRSTMYSITNSFGEWKILVRYQQPKSPFPSVMAFSSVHRQRVHALPRRKLGGAQHDRKDWLREAVSGLGERRGERGRGYANEASCGTTVYTMRSVVEEHIVLRLLLHGRVFVCFFRQIRWFIAVSVCVRRQKVLCQRSFSQVAISVTSSCAGRTFSLWLRVRDCPKLESCAMCWRRLSVGSRAVGAKEGEEELP